MDFAVRYSAEQEAFRKEVRIWLDEHVDRALLDADDHRDSYENYQRRRELGRKLGARGWLYPTAPVEYGGGGLDHDRALVLIEEMRAFGLSLPPYYDSGGALGSVAILVWGTEEQKRALLPPIYRGEQRTWQLLTEPNAGSDLAAVSTRAVRDGDHYVINGQKIFIGSPHGCEAMWTIVRTGAAEARHNNLSWFMIDASLPGITVAEMNLMGGELKNTVYFDDVRVPASALVGGENQGWKVATTHLELEHGLRTDHMIGYRLERLMAAVVARCKEPCSDGTRLVDDPRVQDALADAYVQKEIVRLLGLRNFWLATTRRERTYEGSQAYLLEKKTSQRFAHVVLDLLGASSLVAGSDRDSQVINAHHAGAIAAMHGGGTAEIQKLVMARRIGIGRSDAERAGRLA